LKFASLGSGSKGNALLISASSGTSSTTVMLDCGFGIRETERRLARLDVHPSGLSAIIVTHEHHDHIGGAFKFARRHRLPVWLSYGTYQAAIKDSYDVDLNFCRDGDPISIGDLQFLPFTVPHDAREPLQFCASNGNSKLGILTDAGQSTPHLIQALAVCDALMIECNHDSEMLSRSGYPMSLKRRIRGVLGHLSNDDTSAILANLDQTRLKKVVGAHLSLQNNTPELARNALCAAIHTGQTEVVVACQQDGFGWIDTQS
jgi:phosphoribosyl 1,2-cyclic phosphodiesterase